MLAWCCLAACAGSCAAAGGPLRLTYLGNEGFLIRAGGKSVLIDAISGAGLRGYVPLPAEPRARLENARPPFGKVDLVLATHAHADHFDAGRVGRYLELAPRAEFVSTVQAADLVRQHAGDLDRIRDRVHGCDPPAGQRLELSPGGIRVQSFHLTHGDTPNLGFIVQLGGKKVLHVGDTDAGAAAFARYDLPRDEIDLALIPFWMLLTEGGRATLREHVGAAHVVAMHVPEETAPPRYFGESRTAERLYADLEAAWPGVIVLREPMDVRVFR